MPGKYCQWHDELSGFELQQLLVVELLELRTCLTVAEKALLWQAPRIDLEANMVLEASMMYMQKLSIKTEWKEAIAGCEMRSNGWKEEAFKLGDFENFALGPKDSSGQITHLIPRSPLSGPSEILSMPPLQFHLS